jgi:hypothetical protein
MRTPLAAFLAIVLAGSAVAGSGGASQGDDTLSPSVVVAVLASPRTTPPPTGYQAAGAIGTVLLGGFATWYETPGLTAAAGPVLRDVLGDWRGQWVTVEGDGASVTVQLTDFCACGERHGLPTLLDLSDAAFSELAPLSAGVIRVAIEIDPPEHPDDARMRLEDRDLPATSTEDGA